MRGLIVLFTIVALSISLIVLMPTEFFTAGVDEESTVDPNTLDLVAWNSTYSLNMTYNAGSVQDHEFELNGYNYLCSVFPEKMIHLSTHAEWWIFVWDRDDFVWRDEDNIIQSEPYVYLLFTWESINSSVIDEYDTPAKWNCRNGKTQVQVTTAYNTTAYGNFTAALEDSAATLVFQVDWHDRNTSMNALQLVGMVLTGSLPDISTELSIVFGVLAWGLVAAGVYMAFIFILRIVGAIFGGGGA